MKTNGKYIDDPRQKKDAEPRASDEKRRGAQQKKATPPRATRDMRPADNTPGYETR